ncbi:MAG: hypothetical protein IPF72_10125 [Chitinophagaceae bacterium]|nr:hypothetical protein [Chitinophagaceae bacterium]
MTDYAAGGQGGIAKVWKNGVPTSLTNGSFNAYVYSVYVSGTDVYAAGFENNANNKSVVLRFEKWCYFENGYTSKRCYDLVVNGSRYWYLPGRDEYE